MKVLIHAIDSEGDGEIRFLSGLVANLKNAKSIFPAKPTYYILLRHNIDVPPSSHGIKIIRIPSWVGSQILKRILVDNLIVPFFVWIKKIDTLVSLTSFGPLWGVKNHINFQSDAFYFSSWYGHQLPLSQKVIYFIRQVYLRNLINRANKVVVPSQSMLNLIPKNLIEPNPDKFIVFPPAVEIQPRLEVNLVPSRLVGMTPKSLVTFFYPSLYGAQKGFPTLFRALGRLNRIHGLKFKALLTARLDDCEENREKFATILRQEQIENDVVFLEKVTPQELDYLYRNVTALVFPSVLESFSFPLAEALSYNLPIVASDTPINREICQSAALYYSPSDPEGLSQQLKSIFDTSTRDKLSAEAKSQFDSRDWGWAAYVREFEKLM